MYKSFLATTPWRVSMLLAVWILCAADPAPGSEAQRTETLPPSTLEAAVGAAAKLPRLHSLLVSRRGEMILERYYNGRRPERLANIKSVSKSVISAAVGIAIDRGFITSGRQPIADFFPDLLGSDDDAPKREITIEDLLTMRSGLESTSNRNYGAWVLSRNWVQYALARPLLNPPGKTMEYSTGNAHLLSAILTKVTGTSTWHFVQETVAKPLDFRLARWPQDPQGIYFGGNDMLMTPRQMVAFGELYLNNGHANGQQIVPARWVKASLVPRARSRRESGRFYGYGWWMREMAGHQTIYAWGYGGQFIFLVPDLDLVIVTTASTSVSDERHHHRRAVLNLVERFVIGAISLAGKDSAIASTLQEDPRAPFMVLSSKEKFR